MSAPSTKHARPGRPKDDDLAARRRAEIVVHAIDEFARNGYAGADLDRIAAGAGCSKGTLYNYFASKEELFAASVDHVMFCMVESTGGNDDDEDAVDDHQNDPIARIEQLVYGFLQYFADHPQYVELLVQERSHLRDRAEPTYHRYREAKKQRWYARFNRLIADGRMRSISPETAMTVVADLLYGTIFMNYFRHRTTDPKKQAAEVLQVLLGGLLTESAFAAQAQKKQ